MAREIDNFYPERFTYHNVRLWDEESAQLLPHWKETHHFVEAARWGHATPPPAPPQLPALCSPCPSPACPALRFAGPQGPHLLSPMLWEGSLRAALPPHGTATGGDGEADHLWLHRAQGTRVLVHCKMGVSRSAATVIAYAMKQYGWSLEQALRHVQELRPIARPNPGFLRQLQTYQGILTARYAVEGQGRGRVAAAGGGHWVRKLTQGPPCSRQSHVWEQKAGGASPEEPLAPEVSTPFPPLQPEPGSPGWCSGLLRMEHAAPGRLPSFSEALFPMTSPMGCCFLHFILHPAGFVCPPTASEVGGRWTPG